CPRLRWPRPAQPPTAPPRTRECWRCRSPAGRRRRAPARIALSGTPRLRIGPRAALRVHGEGSRRTPGPPGAYSRSQPLPAGSTDPIGRSGEDLWVAITRGVAFTQVNSVVDVASWDSHRYLHRYSHPVNPNNPVWRKSRHSFSNGNCVEVASAPSLDTPEMV